MAVAQAIGGLAAAIVPPFLEAKAAKDAVRDAEQQLKDARRQAERDALLMLHARAKAGLPLLRVGARPTASGSAALLPFAIAAAGLVVLVLLMR